MTSEIPKHQLLLKLLRMTESDNDNEALIGLRKANSLLREAGWDWEKLLAGKIKVIGDPWASIPTPPKREPEPDYSRPYHGQTPPRQAPRPQPQPKPQQYMDLDGSYWSSQYEADRANARIRVRRAAEAQQRAAAAAVAQPAMPTIASTRTNGFSGNCYCCGKWVNAGSGWIFKPAAKWEVVCDADNKSTAPIPSKAAKKQTPSTKDIFGAFGS